MPGVTLHRCRCPAAARGAPARAGRWRAAVVARPRDLGRRAEPRAHARQDVYRAGEGCHRAYLDATATAQPARRSIIGSSWRSSGACSRTTPAGRRDLAAGRRRDRAALRRAAGPAERRLQRRRSRALPSGQPRAATGRARAPRPAFPTGRAPLLFVGSGFERKGLATAIEALAALGDRGSRLLVLGKGDRGAYRQPRRAARRRRARRAGSGRGHDIERWYAAADVVVLPTRYEPFGNVHLEALASGVPVVTSDARRRRRGDRRRDERRGRRTRRPAARSRRRSSGSERPQPRTAGRGGRAPLGRALHLRAPGRGVRADLPAAAARTASIFLEKSRASGLHFARGSHGPRSSSTVTGR